MNQNRVLNVATLMFNSMQQSIPRHFSSNVHAMDDGSFGNGTVSGHSLTIQNKRHYQH